MLQYALPLAKNGRYPPILKGIQLNADIKLKPKAAFKAIKVFAPLHQMLLAAPYHGDKTGFCRAMGTRTVSEYNNFGTVEGVLYHELLHVMLAKVFAKQLQAVAHRCPSICCQGVDLRLPGMGWATKYWHTLDVSGCTLSPRFHA